MVIDTKKYRSNTVWHIAGRFFMRLRRNASNRGNETLIRKVGFLLTETLLIAICLLQVMIKGIVHLLVKDVVKIPHKE
jgi:hypothetical protein